MWPGEPTSRRVMQNISTVLNNWVEFVTTTKFFSKQWHQKLLGSLKKLTSSGFEDSIRYSGVVILSQWSEDNVGKMGCIL